MSLQSGRLNLEDLKNGSFTNLSDADLDQSIKQSVRAHTDLDEIRNDPFYNQTVAEIKNSKTPEKKKVKSIKDREREDFIKGAIAKAREENNIAGDLKTIHFEMGKSNINDLTADWVNEWHRRKRSEITSAHSERESFISNSLRTSAPADEKEPETAVLSIQEKVQVEPAGKNKFLRYALISAAASLAGAALIFSTLLPPSSPDKLFNTFFEPYEAISPVMRDGNSAADNYASAIMYYKAGDLDKAAYYFEQSSLNDPSLRSPVFYLGLTDMANGNYDDAITRFKTITNSPGAYTKEARWYLGLTYLKKGDINNARDCFSALAESEGYYMERSEEILRRLK